jgi:hypothetical protein
MVPPATPVNAPVDSHGRAVLPCEVLRYIQALPEPVITRGPFGCAILMAYPAMEQYLESLGESESATSTRRHMVDSAVDVNVERGGIVLPDRFRRESGIDSGMLVCVYKEDRFYLWERGAATALKRSLQFLIPYYREWLSGMLA